MEEQSPSNDSIGLGSSGVSKWFSGVPALEDVSIAIHPGRIAGLVGHNGAGKSTLLNILSGALRPDAGTVFLNGVPVELHSPAMALSKGIATVHQELSLLANLTVTQNVFLAQERTQFGFMQHKSMRDEAQEMVDQFGLEIDVTRKVGDYPVAVRQLLELAIATHRDAQFLLLDEPTTSLEGNQVEKLLDTVRSLARNRGVGILLIDHKLDEVYAVADHIVVLVDGQVRVDASAESVDRRDVVRTIAGDETVKTNSAPSGYSSYSIKTTAADLSVPGEISVKVQHLKTKALEDVSLCARAGRVLGVYGLVGSGRTEFLHTLIGLDRVISGEIELFGHPYRPRNPAAARKLGVVYLTEERKRDGIIAPLDSMINVSLPVLERFRRLGFLDRGEMKRQANRYLDVFRVLGDRSRPVTHLSGGNQQKVLFARALAQEPRVLLLDEPTKGVDIGVNADIRRTIRELAHERGLTIIVVSSEEEEILEVADDVAVFIGGVCDGKIESTTGLTAGQLRRAAWVPD